MEQFKEKIKKVATLLQSSRYAVAITGPGLSAAEESAHLHGPTGMWTMFDPDDFTIQRFKENPNAFYEFGVPFFSMLDDAPTEAHKALAGLEKMGLIKTIITKNVDGFHQEAGAKNVLEIYGSLRSASCTSCPYHVQTGEIMEDIESGQLPLCPDCGKPLRPDVVLPGEPLTEDFHQAEHEIAKSDLVFVVGTEIISSPVKELLLENSNLVMVGSGLIAPDSRAKEVINESPQTVLPLLLKAL